MTVAASGQNHDLERIRPNLTATHVQRLGNDMKAGVATVLGGGRALPGLWEAYKSGGDVLLFVTMSLVMALFIGQERIISKGDTIYWLLIIPAVLMPLIRARETIGNLLFGCARPLAFFCLAAGTWCFFRRDFGAFPPVFLIAWVAAWACRDEIRLSRKALFAVTLGFYLIASLVFFLEPSYENYPWLLEIRIPPEAADFGAQSGTAPPSQALDGLNFNAWGILPMQTAPAFEPWRVSATPNIATSGIFSLLVFLIVMTGRVLRPLPAVTAISTFYFALLSFVRAVFIGMLLFTASFLLMRALSGKPKLRTIVAFVMVVGVSALVALSPYILFHLQGIELVSRMFLRGQTGLSVSDIYRQAYRPWLWAEHFKLFWDSRFFLGYGSELATSATSNVLNVGQIRSDSVSFLTRLLATYGVSSFGMIIFVCERAYRHARNNDAWAIAMLALIVWLMMTWGSVFHPTNGIYVLAFLIMGKGTSAFDDDETGAATGIKPRPV